MSAKFTAGPWHAEQSASREWPEVCAGAELVARVYRYDNARLIAAAPDMYKLLQMAVASRNGDLGLQLQTDQAINELLAKIDGDSQP